MYIVLVMYTTKAYNPYYCSDSQVTEPKFLEKGNTLQLFADTEADLIKTMTLYDDPQYKVRYFRAHEIFPELVLSTTLKINNRVAER